MPLIEASKESKYQFFRLIRVMELCVGDTNRYGRYTQLLEHS